MTTHSQAATMAMTFGSLFAGIGGFDLGLESAGLRCLFQVEKDPTCRKVLASYWPQTLRIDDILRYRYLLEGFRRGRIATKLPRPDLLCGGFPCQDLSVAGKRNGLAGERSGLWFVFRRIIGILRPTWVLIENVPGLRSSAAGRDLSTVLGGLEKLGYGWAYRTIDAQYLGLAQRRKRVFIVGHLGSVERAARALFEPVGLSWDPSPRQETRAKPAAPLTAGSASGRGVNRPGRRREDDENLAIVNTLDRHMGGLDDNAAQAGHIVFQNAGGSCWREGQPTLATSDDNGTNQVVTESYVTHTLRAEGHDASEDGTGRGVPLIGVQSSQSGVRRLTPRECERLQGFPDDWTRWDDSGKELSDSARYRMLGNAVARPVAEWIGRRILASATP